MQLKAQYSSKSEIPSTVIGFYRPEILEGQEKEIWVLNIEDAGDELFSKLSKDLKAAAKNLKPHEVRFLVDSYYQMQDNRIRAAGQVRALNGLGEPHELCTWLADRNELLEKQVKAALDIYSANNPVGKWSRTVKGIGPVIAAGLLAHIDITKAPTVGHIWRFAGQDPTLEWKKGEKRGWNASLKVLCWKIGESFVKVSGYDDAFFGKIYSQRKALETERNEAGAFADQAKAKLEKFKIGKTTEAYKHYSGGKLPPAHIHARAKRYAVKLFLSKWHETAYREHYKTDPPKPYAIAILGHAHQI